MEGKLKDDVERPLAAILMLNTVAHTTGAAGAVGNLTHPIPIVLDEVPDLQEYARKLATQRAVNVRRSSPQDAGSVRSSIG